MYRGPREVRHFFLKGDRDGEARAMTTNELSQWLEPKEDGPPVAPSLESLSGAVLVSVVVVASGVVASVGVATLGDGLVVIGGVA